MNDGISFMQNRELSWLRFNDRVLDEALDPNVPLLEQIKFAAIFASNLDEFFMVRVGSLTDMCHSKNPPSDMRTNMTPHQQLDAIYKAVRPLYGKRDAVWSQIRKSLKKEEIERKRLGGLAQEEQKLVRHYYENAISPILSPQVVDTHHPFPHLINLATNIILLLKPKGRRSVPVVGLVTLPSALPCLFFLQGQEKRYVLVEDIVLAYIDSEFSEYTVTSKHLVRVTRNADINEEDEPDELDFRRKMRKLLIRRRRMAAVRLEINRTMPDRLEVFLCERLGIEKKQFFLTKAPMRFSLQQLSSILSDEQRAKLSYPVFLPQQSPNIVDGVPIYRQIKEGNLLLAYPYESMEPVLRMLREAATDPSVLSVKICLYRVGQRGRLIDYLCSASENGKEVSVFIELRARFDEENNINWSERLEEAGCRVFYGSSMYKNHAKICLITRQERGELSYLTQVATGNYNENTAEQYEDLSYFTVDKAVGEDAASFFNNMATGNLEGKYQRFLVAPLTLKPAILSLIDGQIARGSAGYVFMKVNSMTDIDIVRKLSEASCAGVQVELVVRGICCLLPGLPGLTDRVRVTSIVGRFLEHSRIYAFGTGEAQQLFLSSADMMSRNTTRRVEVACPILDPVIRQLINERIDLMLRDNVKARYLRSDGHYERKPAGLPLVDSQAEFIAMATSRAKLLPSHRSHRSSAMRVKLKSILEEWARRL